MQTSMIVKKEENTDLYEKHLKILLEKCLKDWCEETTSHGFFNIIKTKNWISKIFWILIVITGISYSFQCNNYSILLFFFIFKLLILNEKRQSLILFSIFNIQ